MDIDCPNLNDTYTRGSLMKEIMEYKFAICDLALYCNTHPEDQNAIVLHNDYCYKAKYLVDRYQKEFGPLTIECPCNSWRWLEQPWPWERGGS